MYVPVVALLTLWPRTQSAPDRRLIQLGLLATAAPATILPLVFGGRRMALLYEAASPYTFGALALFGVLVWLTLRRKATGALAPWCDPAAISVGECDRDLWRSRAAANPVRELPLARSDDASV